MPRTTVQGDGREVFIEIVTVGASAKVSAIDSVSGTEVSIIGPANADRRILEAAVIQKLHYVLNKTKPTER